MEKQRWKKIFGNCINLVCLGTLLFSVYRLVPIFYDYYTNRKVLAEIQDVYQANQKEKKVDEENKDGTIRSVFTELLQINKDIVGWIEVPDTLISYPILQSDNNEFYLSKNYRKENSRAGSIFMDYRNDVKNMGKNTILYGHRMKDQSMFAQLNKYLDSAFFERHRMIYFDTLYERYDAEIFSVYTTTTDFYYIETDFSSDQDFLTFIQQVKDRSLYQTAVEIGPTDKIITLSTCDYSYPGNEGRLVVHAKLIKHQP
ncbi:class B sortase [Caldifermentibacillus hisashii]